VRLYVLLLFSQGFQPVTRPEQHHHNQVIIDQIKRLHAADGGSGYSIPSYLSVVFRLNRSGLGTSRGNPWTRQSLFRMLQRQGYAGLHGLLRSSQ